MIYDLFMLCQSYAIGYFSNYGDAVQNPCWENKLHNSYMEHIHLLFINKKIENEDDLMIFNANSKVITDEESRDYLINQLSGRLEQTCLMMCQEERDI